MLALVYGQFGLDVTDNPYVADGLARRGRVSRRDGRRLTACRTARRRGYLRGSASRSRVQDVRGAAGRSAVPFGHATRSAAVVPAAWAVLAVSGTDAAAISRMRGAWRASAGRGR